ncbi:MAG: hypothetical protein IJ848_02900, partial [Alphaproteobacteria bacterium]|nr:hypothetical protein [Alphaproteobacteria bacterium]
KDAQYLWTKLSSSEQIKAQIRAREKYALCSDSEIAIALAREMDKASEIATAKNEGLIEGEKKGENKAKKELALNMRNQGFQDTVIAKCLNISIEELHNLFA